MRALPRYTPPSPLYLSDKESFLPMGFDGQHYWSKRGLYLRGYRIGWEACEEAWVAGTLDLIHEPPQPDVRSGYVLVHRGFDAGYRACLDAIRRGEFESA